MIGRAEEDEVALRNWAYIYLSPGFSPEQNTVSTESSGCRFTAIGLDFADKERVVDIVHRLVTESGVQMVELCGGFGPLWIARVSEAIGGAVPVGSVAYGPEARQPMLELLADEQSTSLPHTDVR
ncbi:DUF6506 family protein [Lentzea sp. E54]|uniref:DUF6506 family protein n=1 Tax=Lentzea xerophila TaxID=3435883 RepID=UPI003DA65229